MLKKVVHMFSFAKRFASETYNKEIYYDIHEIMLLINGTGFLHACGVE